MTDWKVDQLLLIQPVHFRWRAGKVLKTWCSQQEAGACAATSVPLALTSLSQAALRYVLQTLLARLLTAVIFPACDALVCPSAYLQLRLWVQPSASPVLGGLVYSACEAVFRLDFMCSLAGTLRLTQHMEMDCWFCTTTAALSLVNGVQKDKKHYPVRKDQKALLQHIDLSTSQALYFSLKEKVLVTIKSGVWD